MNESYSYGQLYMKYAAELSKATTREYTGHRDKIHAVGWSCDGRKLSAGCTDGSCHVWSAQKERQPFVLRGHKQSIDRLVWDPSNADVLATGSIDKTIRIWDIRQKSSTHTVDVGAAVLNMAWKADGSCIAVGTKSDTISFIDPRGGSGSTDAHQWITHQIQNDIEINEIGWTMQGNHLIAATGYGQLRIYQSDTFELVHSVAGHTANCFCLAFDPHGQYLILKQVHGKWRWRRDSDNMGS